MSQPFWKADPRMWALAVQHWVEGSEPWPRDLVVEDLRWWADQVRMGFQSLPGRPTLAKRWGWGDKRARLILAEVDPLEQQGPARGQPGASQGPARGQPGASRTTGKPTQSVGKGQLGASQGPARGQPRANEGPHARTTEHRTQNTEHTPEEVSSSPTALPLVLTPPESQQPDDWQQLADFYATLPHVRKPSKRDSPAGVNLQRMLDTLGREDAQSMLQWMAYATGCAKASSLDEGGYRVLSTVSRPSHLEDYWPHVARWVAAGRPGAPDARSPIQHHYRMIKPTAKQPTTEQT